VGSKFAVLGGLCLVQCLTLLSLVDLGCGLKAPWLPLLLLLWLSAMVGTAVGLILSALARTSEVAIALLPVVLLPMVILGGSIQPIHKMHRASRLMCQFVPTRWAFEGLALVEGRPSPPFPGASAAGHGAPGVAPGG